MNLPRRRFLLRRAAGYGDRILRLVFLLFLWLDMFVKLPRFGISGVKFDAFFL